jgi:nitrate/TMAO reductase-like tetraheme cytochrome c subunit
MIAATLFVIVLAGATAAVLYQVFLTLRRSAAIAVCVVTGAMAGFVVLPVLRESPEPMDPQRVSYESSSSCVKCHAQHYETWHDTYHRTMTQEASPDTVLGRFDGEELRFKGLACYPFRKGDRFFMDLIDMDWEARTLEQGKKPSEYPNPPRVTWEVSRLVGSHNMQVYLTRQNDGRYMVLPLVWHTGEQRWISREGSFLVTAPPSLYAIAGQGHTWNFGCVFCHNTQPNPGVVMSRDRSHPVAWNTRLEEMGIACEACHGPAGRHVAANHNPLRRSYLQQTGCSDPTIVNPAKISQEASVQACGYCHGKWRPKPEFMMERLTRGQIFKPGEWGLEKFYTAPEPKEEYSEQEDGGYFWPDWTPRPSALEYQGVLQSLCYEQGQMTCLSCHSMHRSGPDDQLIFPEDPRTTAFESNQACTQCHTQYTSDDQVAAHTRHDPHSPGSRCDNCHMPFQAYGLLKAIRSHRISSPDIARTTQYRVPNACNQCHVDKSLAWTGEWLSQWYRREVPSMTEEAQTLSATVLDLLEGHAMNRALAAAQLGWPDAMTAAPGTWRAPFLTYALDDKYAAVRLLAYQSLRKLPGFEDLQYDYLADDDTRRRQIEEARSRWSQIAETYFAPVGQEVPLQLDGQPISELIDRLLKRQDQTEVNILE